MTSRLPFRSAPTHWRRTLLSAAVFVVGPLVAPSPLPALAALLREAGITHIHTTDLKRTRETGAPLGGESHGPIADMEYDRLYVVVIPREAPVSTTLLRFGAPWAP